MHQLIIRPGAIGDTLLTFPVLHQIRAQYPECSLTLVGNAAVLPLALACGIVDEAYDYQERRWLRLFVSGSEQGDIVQRSERVVCWMSDPEGIVEQNIRQAGVDQIIVAPGRPGSGEQDHIVEYLARTVGLTWRLEHEGRQVSLWLPDHLEWGEERGPVAIHPGSGGAQKCWPVAYFAAVIRELWRRDLPVLLLAGPADHERLAALQTLLGESGHEDCLEVLTDLPLLDVAHRLRLCRAYLGNDSGLTHLAAMLGVPTVALFGPSDHRIWQPPGPVVTVLAEPTLQAIAVERVVDALNRALSPVSR